MTIDDRIMGLALMARNMKKLDPKNFNKEPISGLIDALAQDLEKIADEYLEEGDEE